MKPVFFKSPLAWTMRQIQLKSGDFVRVLGYEPIKKLNFANMSGGDFAHVIDVGVADGSPDLYARFPNAYLDLFEPVPEYHGHVERNVLSKRSGRLHKMGLGSSDTTAELFLKGRTGSSFVADRGRGSITVPVRRLDGVLNPEDIRHPCLLKIDTEGYELEVLRGAENLLPSIDCIVAEVSFYTPDCLPHDLIEHLRVRGFSFTEILDFHVAPTHMAAADFVFRRLVPPTAPSPKPANSARRL